jgi:hypothetical protein
MKHLYDFEGFVNESYVAQELNEAFKSNTLRTISTGATKGTQLTKTFYDALSKMGIAASEIDDSQISEISPRDAAKATKQDPEKLFIYYSNSEKTNPHASREYWNKTVPAGIVLAMVKGGKYQGLEYDRWDSKKGGKAVYRIVSSPDDSIGVDKSRGTYSSGLNTLSKMADVADMVYVIDPNTAPSSTETRAGRVEAKQGAIAFLSDKDFKKANQDRYEQILKDSAAKLPVAGIVQSALDTLTQQIKNAISAGNKNQYGNILIGKDKRDREITMSDASNIMGNLLTAFQRYSEHLNSAEREGGNYYKQSVKNYAKDIKNYVDKINKMDYAW